MPAPSSSCEGGQCESSARRARPLREHVPMCGLERVQRGKPAAGEEPDCPSHPAADSLLQDASFGQQAPSAPRLVTKQLDELRARTVERDHAEPTAVLERQIDATELEIARHVLQEVDEL